MSERALCRGRAALQLHLRGALCFFERRRDGGDARVRDGQTTLYSDQHRAGEAGATNDRRLAETQGLSPLLEGLPDGDHGAFLQQVLVVLALAVQVAGQARPSTVVRPDVRVLHSELVSIGAVRAGRVDRGRGEWRTGEVLRDGLGLQMRPLDAQTVQAGTTRTLPPGGSPVVTLVIDDEACRYRSVGLDPCEPVNPCDLTVHVELPVSLLCRGSLPDQAPRRVSFRVQI